MQNDLISRSALLKEFEKRQEQQINEYCDCFLNDAQELSTEWWCVEDAVQGAPTIDAVPVVHGRVVWRNRFMGGFVPDVTITDKAGEKHTGTLDTTHYEPVPYCSECGKELGVSSLAYCPNCGAKMDGGAENE